MLLFDIGANKGDAVFSGLELGFDKVIALEPAPKIYRELVCNFIYDPRVVPLKFAVSDTYNSQIEFYEAEEDGLSTTNLDWLTSEDMPYKGKAYRTIEATTCTVDWLVEQYGVPDLMKIDVEGAEWPVFRGMTKKYGKLAFEWTENTITEHNDQIQYLKGLGYTHIAPQYIVKHLEEPDTFYEIDKDFQMDGKFDLGFWKYETEDAWTASGWKEANLRPTADVGMIWVK